MEEAINSTALPEQEPAAPPGGDAQKSADAGTKPAPNIGEFSASLSAMAQRLREREAQLKREIQLARRRSEIIKSYTEMLVELLNQREEWLLVVDQETHKIVHCNKRSKSAEEGDAHCEHCRHRLPIQPRLLEWESTEHYQIWELEEEQGGCYRIISFPIEWKERPSCIHIVMDVTAEKTNARLLNDEVYQDGETGIRNRQFLEEFMAQVLRERQDVTLCYLDLEGVSDVNMAFGRETGDAYLQNFVEIVRKNFRSGDTFARVQDDKFCLVLSGKVKHLIERKMSEILTAFQRDDDRVFCHNCNFKFSIQEVEGESNMHTLEDLLRDSEADIKRPYFSFDLFNLLDRSLFYNRWNIVTMLSHLMFIIVVVVIVIFISHDYNLFS